MGTIAKPPLKKIILIQLLLSLAASGLMFPAGIVHSYSLLIGCLIQIAGSAYFARLAYRHQGASKIRAVVQAMYRGETGKILLSIAMFACAFIAVKPLNAGSVFGGYILMLVVHLLLVARCFNGHKEPLVNRP